MDTIANLLTIIRNGYMASKFAVFAPYSKFAQAILEILVKEDYLEGVKILNNNRIKKFEIRLLYKNKKPAITGITKVSKSGRRIYRTWGKIPKTLSGLGVTIVSTPAGVMTDRQAARKKLGGEVICQVW